VVQQPGAAGGGAPQLANAPRLARLDAQYLAYDHALNHDLALLAPKLSHGAMGTLLQILRKHNLSPLAPIAPR
jgi:hypothetical protein